MWREVNRGEWKATAADLSRDLDLLQVPHTIVTAFRFPLSSSSYSKAMREGEDVRILRKDLPHLVPWMPSLEQTIADLPEDAPHWDFTVFQPRADGMAIANWPCRRSGPLGRRSRPAPPGWSVPNATTTCASAMTRPGCRSTSGCPSGPGPGDWCAGSAATMAWTR
jgi:hypothetical protein